MAIKHDWEYKNAGGGFWVICADCGKSDGLYATEEEAKIRRLALRHAVLPSYGFNRRRRKARAS